MSEGLYSHCKIVERGDVKPGWFVCGTDCANQGTPQEVWYELWRPPIGCTSDEEMVRVENSNASDGASVVAKSLKMAKSQMKEETT